MSEQVPINWQEFVALEVNGEEITLPEVLSAAQFQGQLGFLQAIADMALIRQAAAQQGLEVADEELQAAADQFRTKYELHKAADLMRWLTERHLTLTTWETCLEEEVLTLKLREKLTAGKVELHFAQNKLNFDAAEIAWIFVKEETVARELRAQISEEEADFHKLARQHSIDAENKAAGGYAGIIKREELAAEADAAIFGAQPGYITPPIKINKGWYLFKVEALLRATLDDATRETIKAKLFKEWLDERRRKARITMPLFNLLREEEEEV